MQGKTFQLFSPDVYIIGCGPSMKTFNWECLRPLITIAVNGSIMNVPDPTYFLTACSAFSVQSFRSNFWDTRARKVLIMGKDHKNYNKVKPFIHMFDEVYPPSRFDGQLGFSWDAFATGKNSGFCAMQYAVLKGAKTIHLVGFDLNSSGHHYNSGGPSSNTIEVFYNHFVTGIKILQKNGIHVISHTETSRLNGLIPFEKLT